MRTNKKVLIESRKSEDVLTLYELEREKDIVREEREKWILVENGKKTLKLWKENRCHF